ncbi:hypothetical protein [Aneurinibacillus sp. UBA3580]|uniref:hypothetical protein n=1 Tax=Aneurinibacillus sp. UBA3580 TaxID=1946041 RepID=UPI0025798998|nr:hypothetical protein [Aneurinibacillus sp. UBA3580]
MSGAGAVKAMQEHMKRYRLYQQKVREYERLQKQIEEETGKSWREIGGLTDLEEVYGPIVAMMTSRLKKLEYPAKEAAYWLSIMDSAKSCLPDKYAEVIEFLIEGKTGSMIQAELFVSERTLTRVRKEFFTTMAELSGYEEAAPLFCR